MTPQVDGEDDESRFDQGAGHLYIPLLAPGYAMSEDHRRGLPLDLLGRHHQQPGDGDRLVFVALRIEGDLLIGDPRAGRPPDNDERDHQAHDPQGQQYHPVLHSALGLVGLSPRHLPGWLGWTGGLDALRWLPTGLRGLRRLRAGLLSRWPLNSSLWGLRRPYAGPLRRWGLSPGRRSRYGGRLLTRRSSRRPWPGFASGGGILRRALPPCRLAGNERDPR